MWIAYVVVPAHVGGLIDGIPLGGPDACALAAIVWLTARGRRIPGAFAVAAVAAIAAVLGANKPADRGFSARYFSNPDPPPPNERSTELK